MTATSIPASAPSVMAYAEREAQLSKVSRGSELTIEFAGTAVRLTAAGMNTITLPLPAGRVVVGRRLADPANGPQPDARRAHRRWRLRVLMPATATSRRPEICRACGEAIEYVTDRDGTWAECACDAGYIE